MRAEAIQALVGAVLLALGIAFDGQIFTRAWAFDVGEFLAVVGAVALGDYGLDRVLTMWRAKPR